MKIIYFENDEFFLSEEDKDNFYDVVGNSIDDLKSDIQTQPQRLIQQIYSNEKFIYSDVLNKRGLHVYRSLLANNIYKKRNYSDNEEVHSLNDKGYFMIRDYLSDKEFNKLESVFQQVKDKFPNGKHITAEVSNFFQNNQQYFNLIKECAHVKNFSQDTFRGNPRSEFWYHMHTEEDSQFKFHSDTFQPTVKCWLYIEDIGESQGAFGFVPFSNRHNKNRMIWDYENSNMKMGDKLWNKRIESGGKPGSFRVCENSSVAEEREELSRLGFVETMSMTAPKNTLLIANTFGFHKRGTGDVGSFRSTLTSQYRPVAFGVY